MGARFRWVGPALLLLGTTGCGLGTADGDRAPPPATNADLSALTLSPGRLDQRFQAAQPDYTGTLGFLADRFRVIATAEDRGARLRIDGRAVDSGEPGPETELVGGSATSEIVVTAEDGTTTRTYRVEVRQETVAALAQEAYRKASNTDAGDRFGAAVALDGERLVVGAPAEAGAVYVFGRDPDGTWVQEAYLKAEEPDAFDAFGTAVAIDGDTIVVGAPGEASGATSVDGDATDDSAAEAGAAFVFVRDRNGSWRQQAYLKARNAGAFDRFGSAVAVSGDRVAVGAPGEASFGFGLNADDFNDDAPDAGAVYLFVRDGSSWEQENYLKASNTNGGDRFGSAVALDGATLAVGAPDERSAATGVGGSQTDDSAAEAGAVYVFTRSGGVWGQQAYLKASNTDAFDRFGSALALDGDRLAVGAPGEASATGAQGNDAEPEAGAVYLFERRSGAWSQEAYLKSAETGDDDVFGSALALRDAALAVGAPGEDSAATGVGGDATDDTAGDAGAVWLFLRDDAGDWNLEAYLKASNAAADDRFGSAVAIGAEHLAVGAPGEASAATGVAGDEGDDSAPGAGAVYRFR
jgi:hypothetical protein